MLPAGPDTCLGLDLGQSKTCVAADVGGFPRLMADAAGRTLFPSVVSFSPDGSVLVGDDAKRQMLVDPANAVGCDLRPDAVVVDTRAGQITPAQVASILLDYARRVAGAALGTDSRRVVLTLPAALSAARRDDVVAGAALAGLNVEVILTAPAAAATAYGYDERPPVPLVVWDLGGGKFECTVLEMRGRQPAVLATASDPNLGGAEVDRRIAAGMLEAFRDVHQLDLSGDPIALARLLAAAEDAKLALATHEAVTVTVPAIAQSIYGQPIDLKLALPRSTLVARAGDLWARAEGLAAEALRQASLPRDRIGDVILVGGMMRLPPFAERITAVFGRPGRIDVAPEEVCALGAARWGAREQGSLRRQTSPYGAGFAGLAAGPGALGAEIAGATSPARMGRIATKKMFTAVMQLPTITFTLPTPTAPPGTITPPSHPAQPPPGPQQTIIQQPGQTSPPGPPRVTMPPPGGPARPVFEQIRPVMPTPPPTILQQPLPPPPQQQTIMGQAPPQQTIMAEAPLGQPPPPLFTEVTAERLAISTIGGFCDEIIPVNAALPASFTRVFATGRDNQQVVQVSVCQGGSRRFAENRPLGTVVLDGLPARPRGKVRIAVTFAVDVDGVLEASARDEQTGRAQSIRIRLEGAR